MIYAFIASVVCSALVIGYLIWAMLEMQDKHRHDESLLIRRIIALTNPEGLVGDVMSDEPEPGSVNYVDEEVSARG
jgi:hypothetical protein